jgi:PAS domain S-box-containing protein
VYEVRVSQPQGLLGPPTAPLVTAEARLRARMAEIEALYETAPAGIGLVDPELRYVRVNERLAEMNGLAAHDHAGRPVADLVPELPAHVLEAARRSLATGEPVNGVEYSIRSRSQPGRERNFLASIAPIRTAGVVTGGVCVIEDVTSLKQAERLALERFAELEIVKERLAEAERLAGVGSWAWDLLADTVWWSDSLFVLFGKERFVPDANSFWDLVHPDDRPAIRRQWEATSQRGEPYWVEFRIVLDDGSERWLRAIAVLERTPDGVPARLAGTCQLLPGNERPRTPGPRR